MNMKEIYLYQLNKGIKLFLSFFLVSLTVGVIFGLIYLFQTTSFNKDVTSNRLVDSSEFIEEDFGINETVARSTSELLMTTHNHIIGFSFIFFFLGGIFYFNSIVKGFWKLLFIGEPFISNVVSFGSMWGVRYLDENLIYLTIISAVLLYSAFFIMVFISLFELNLKKPA